MSYKTFKLYIAAIKFHNIELGSKIGCCKYNNCTFCSEALRENKAFMVFASPSCVQCHSYLKESPFRHQDQDVPWAAFAFTLAFFAFLRSPEYVPKATTSYILESTVLCSDISPGQRYMTINIKVSKPDPFGEGMTLYVVKSGSSVCTVNVNT